MRRPLLAVLLGLVFVLGLLAAGCGGDDNRKSAYTTTEATTTETVATTTATVATTTATVATDTVATTATTTTTASPGGGIATSANCKAFGELASKLASAFTGAGTDIEKTKAFLQELASKAPEDIRADFKVYADAFAKIAEALKGVDLTKGTPDAATLAKLQKLSTELDQAKLTAAGTHIAAWVQKNCSGVK